MTDSGGHDSAETTTITERNINDPAAALSNAKDSTIPAPSSGGGNDQGQGQGDRTTVTDNHSAEMGGDDFLAAAPEADTDTGVALPAETAAEAAAIKEAIAADQVEAKKKRQDDSDNENEEILEESPDKRWSKRREKVKQRDVPGIDVSYLAMDNETGNEVVWNEVQLSERKNTPDQEKKIKAVFDNLTQLDHVNLVKFHKYWMDNSSDKPRIIFITEYMSSGSMSRFLQRARTSESLSNTRMWKKWTIQILWALNYLHHCDPPIAHANLSCNTIFIQQNGLIKIGTVAPNAIHQHVKTFRENIRNLHYVAPEYEYMNEVTPQADIYSFGICALEMATRGSLSAGDVHIAPDVVQKAIDSLDNENQRDFITSCLQSNPAERPSAHELLFHPALFEVHALKLLAAHVIVESKLIDNLSEDDLRVRNTLAPALDYMGHTYTYDQLEKVQTMVELDKFLEDVKNGIYPLVDFAQLPICPLKSSSASALGGATPTSKMSAAGVDAEQVSAALRDTSRMPSTPRTSTPMSSTRQNSHDDLATANTSEGSEGEHRDHNHLSATESEQGHVVSYDSGISGMHPFSGDAHRQHLEGQPSNGHDNAEGGSGIVGAEGHDEHAGANGISDGHDHHHHHGDGEDPDRPKEFRKITSLKAVINSQRLLHLYLTLDDSMSRELTTEITDQDTGDELCQELVYHGFICQTDAHQVAFVLSNVLYKHRNPARADDSDTEHLPHTQTNSPASSTANVNAADTSIEESASPPPSSSTSMTSSAGSQLNESSDASAAAAAAAAAASNDPGDATPTESGSNNALASQAEAEKRARSRSPAM